MCKTSISKILWAFKRGPNLFANCLHRLGRRCSRFMGQMDTMHSSLGQNSWRRRIYYCPLLLCCRPAGFAAAWFWFWPPPRSGGRTSAGRPGAAEEKLHGMRRRGEGQGAAEVERRRWNAGSARAEAAALRRWNSFLSNQETSIYPSR